MRHLSLTLQALADLAKRYATVFQEVWQIRHTLDPRQRNAHEVDFLPAALALQETPVSPAPRIAMWLLMSFALITLLWSIFGQIDVVATARGKIIPNEGTKTIQSMETAVVKAIHVIDGQQVKAGDVLLELDATAATADSSRFSNDAVSMRLQAARARAVLAGIERGKLPPLETVPDVDAARMAEEQRQAEGQFNEFRAKLLRIESDIARRDAELHSTKEIVRKLEQTVPIARQRAKDFKELVEQDYVSRHGYLEKEQARIEQEADLATQRSRLRELSAALQQGKADRAALIAETRRVMLDSISDAGQKFSTADQELVKAQQRGKLMRLVAPVDGSVQQLAVHTVGGVVTPAQVLMMVVPQNTPLEVEAFLENKDIGFIKVGQDAEVKIETFSYTKYGTIHAVVSHVSLDAINDEKKGLIYSTRAKLDRTTMQVDDTTINLTPGMAVTMEIKIAQRRVIEYFLSPLLAYQNESLRER